MSHLHSPADLIIDCIKFISSIVLLSKLVVVSSEMNLLTIYHCLFNQLNIHTFSYFAFIILVF